MDERSSRGVRSFIDIRKGEFEPAVLFFLFWYFVIVVFQALRPLKKGLFVEHLGADVELYAKLANIGVAILAVVVFTALYNRVGSRRLIPALCGLFFLALLGFAVALGGGGVPSAPLNWSFYLFGDAWSTVWVTSFWAYLNELTRTEQSKRLYGLIGAGGVIGGLMANLAVWQYIEASGIGVLLTGAAGVTIVIGLIVLRLEALARRPGTAIGRQGSRVPGTGEPIVASRKENAALDGARLVIASKYLLAVAMITFLYEINSQILDYQYSTAAEAVEGAGGTQAFFGRVGTIVGVISVITQLFLVSFIIRKFRITTALLVLPAAMAVASGIYFVTPMLATAALLTISDNSLSYSINQTARETLYVPTSDDVKYKARAFINMLIQRIGKGAAILMALGFAAMADLPIRYLSLLALVVVVIWGGFAWYAGRRFDALTAQEVEDAHPVSTPAPARA
ncbi:MAG TPA: Npt1/Npt2 family nucleotide transporter [Vicinamibacterales bacterium]|nr:Npt1/Npt2 family nucleotide transporter [Vicinamibacterales bacterium]